jgi:hypothetical protein
MTDKLEKIWKEAIMAYSRHCPAIYLAAEENDEKCIIVTDVQVEIRAKQRATTSPVLYHYTFRPAVCHFLQLLLLLYS